MRILCSFNKKGIEAEHWSSEVSAASDSENAFIPFDHTQYLDPGRYLDAWSLDRLYQDREPGLMRLYHDFQAIVRAQRIDAVVVNHCPPYHPDFLRTVDAYKVLYSSDDPDSTYRRNIPYLHAYQHVLFADPVYSPDMDMTEKMRYCGMVNADWCPIGVMNFEMVPDISEERLFSHQRDIDVLYIGSFFRQKLELLARVKKALGNRVVIHGMFKAKHNLYFVARHGYPSWVRPVSFADRTQLYQRAKIGFNIHWNEYGLGNQRLYFLPANGVMQISDCADSLGRVFDVGSEVESYRNAEELIGKLRYYLDDPSARESIARAGYRRAMRDYRFGAILRRTAGLIAEGMRRIGWQRNAGRAS